MTLFITLYDFQRRKSIQITGIITRLRPNMSIRPRSVAWEVYSAYMLLYRSENEILFEDI